MFARSVLSLVVAASLLATGCNTVLSPSGDTGESGTGSTSGSASLAVGNASDATRTALEVVGWSVAAILPVKDLRGMVEGTLALPTCPLVEANIAANALAITFDYGEGCKPSPYSEPTLAGKVGGSSYVTLNAFDLDFVDVAFDGVTLEGNAAGGHHQADGITTLAMSVSLRVDGGFTVHGSVTIELDATTGDYSFAEAALTFHTDDLGTWLAEYENATVSFAQTGSFRAMSGSAIAELVPISLDDPTQTIEVSLAD